MTPKEKAKELVMYSPFFEINEKKQNALIVCFEIIKFIDQRMEGWLDADWISWWEDVIIEINKY
jgi:hypothetical protein